MRVLFCTGFMLTTLPSGDHKLVATFEGNSDLEASSSLPFYVTAGGVRCNILSVNWTLCMAK